MTDTGYLGRLLGQGLTSEERRRVLEELFVFGRENQRPHVSRMAVLLVVSTIIAACGLMADSAAVVIGAMLVAPLMRPVMAAAAAISLGWSKRLYSSLGLVLALAVAAVLIALAIALLSPDFIRIPEQVMSRTRPTFFDLVIALAAGVAGAYTMTRKEATAIPGVAMAVALLPPLASAGILIDFGNLDLALRAFVLFLVNFLAMILAGSLTFLATGVSAPNVVSRFSGVIRYYLVLVLALVLGLSVPLFYYSTEVWFDAEHRAANFPELQEWLRQNQLELAEVSVNQRRKAVFMHLVGPEPPMTIEGLYEILVAPARARGAADSREWSLEMEWTQQTRSSWPPPESSAAGAPHPEVDAPPTPDELLGKTWRWRATQYNDEEWVGLEKAGVYEFSLADEEDGDHEGKVSVQVDCNRATGAYELRDFSLRLEVLTATRAQCSEPDLDLAFLHDLNRVVNLRLEEDDTLVLRLDNDAGMMYFERSEASNPQ